MALKSDPISSIQPFWHIDCPVCGGDDFTELGTGGGVWCDTCNAEFRVRGTSGDAGCVVDCFIGDVCNTLKLDGTKLAWRKALSQLGAYRNDLHRKPKIYAYRIMKEPDCRGTYCTDDRGWIASLHGRVLAADIPDFIKDGSRTYTHLKGPLVSREVALEYGAAID
jgi:hypothetical protein